MTTIAENITRIQQAKAAIKTAIEEKGIVVGDGTIDTYAAKIEEIPSDSGHNAYKVGTVLDMGRIDASKLNDGDMCVVMDNNHSYLPYRTNVLTRILIFPESFTATTTPEEFSDVNFGVFSNGNLVVAGGSVSLTNSGGGCTSGSGSGGSGSGSGGSGSGSTTPTLFFDLVFSSSATPKPCRNFSCEVRYSYDEDTDIWTRAEIVSTEPVVGNTVILPLECGFNKTGGGNLPDIIFDCIKLPNHVADPVAAGKSATGSNTIDNSHMYDGLYLPYEVIYDGSASSYTVLKNINPQYGVISFIKSWNSSGALRYQMLLPTSLFGWTGSVYYLQDTENPTHFYLNSITIQNNNTNEDVYMYSNYNSTYPNYDIYLCLPEEYYAITNWSGSVGFIGTFFNQISVEKPRMYRYDATEGLWMAQL